jgi:hypothetical protein
LRRPRSSDVRRSICAIAESLRRLRLGAQSFDVEPGECGYIIPSTHKGGAANDRGNRCGFVLRWRDPVRGRHLDRLGHGRNAHFLNGHPVLTKPDHGRVLPPSWRTLYELTKLEPKLLEAEVGKLGGNAVAFCYRILAASPVPFCRSPRSFISRSSSPVAGHAVVVNRLDGRCVHNFLNDFLVGKLPRSARGTVGPRLLPGRLRMPQRDFYDCLSRSCQRQA